MHDGLKSMGSEKIAHTSTLKEETYHGLKLRGEHSDAKGIFNFSAKFN